MRGDEGREVGHCVYIEGLEKGRGSRFKKSKTIKNASSMCTGCVRE